MPDGLTPTCRRAARARFAHAQALARAPTRPTRWSVLLATDGLPSECAPTRHRRRRRPRRDRPQAGTPGRLDLRHRRVRARGAWRSAQTNLDTLAAAGGTRQRVRHQHQQPERHPVVRQRAEHGALVRASRVSTRCPVSMQATADRSTTSAVNVQFTPGTGPGGDGRQREEPGELQRDAGRLVLRRRSGRRRDAADDIRFCDTPRTQMPAPTRKGGSTCCSAARR